MSSKVLQGVGVAALMTLVGGSFAALAIVRGRIQVTIEEEEVAARGPDPIALLAADLAVLREDVHAMGVGVGNQLQSSSEALDAAAVEREARMAASLAELRRELQSIREPADRPEPFSEPATSASAEPVSVVEVTPTAPAPKKRFLSFQLPSGGFVFEGRQRFAIVPSLSRVGFDAKSTLHDFSGVTTAVEGEIAVDLSRPGESCTGAVRAQASTLDTGLADRDEAMREILEPSRYPEIRFDWNSFEATRVDAAGQSVAGLAGGSLTIHGISRGLTMPVSVVVDASKRLAIEGQATIQMSDFGVKPPSKLGLISVEDEATVWIALRARTLGQETAGR